MKDTTPIFDPEGSGILLALRQGDVATPNKAFLVPMLDEQGRLWRMKFGSLQPPTAVCKKYKLAYFSIHSSDGFHYSKGNPLSLKFSSGEIPVYPYPDMASLLTWLPIKECFQKHSDSPVQDYHLKDVRDWISYEDAANLGPYEESTITGFDVLGI